MGGAFLASCLFACRWLGRVSAPHLRDEEEEEEEDCPTQDPDTVPVSVRRAPAVVACGCRRDGRRGDKRHWCGATQATHY